MHGNLAVIAVFTVFYSLVAGGMARTIISGPILFVTFGLVAGPAGLGILDIDLDQHTLRTLIDMTLCLVLFVDAASADLRVLKRRLAIPQRMLLIGLPLVIVLGCVVGALIFGQLSIYEAAILGTMLAATDAVLGKGVITNEAVPPRIREGLNLESGLNDGLCVPVLLTFIALASGTQGEGSGTGLAIKLVVSEIGVGILVGIGITAVGFGLHQVCHKLGWISKIWLQVTVVALAVACFAVAQSLHGSGYIAAFAGGMLFGFLDKTKSHKHVKASEGTAETLALITWVVFGAAVVGHFYAYFTWEVLLYAVLSLTVVRMVPMYLALTGSGESKQSILIMGWFGPHGLASIVFVIIVVGEDLPGGGVLAVTVVCTVCMSIVLHGISANPLANRFAAQVNEQHYPHSLSRNAACPAPSLVVMRKSQGSSAAWGRAGS